MRKHKRLLSIITVLAFLMTLFPFAVFASETEVLSTPTVSDDTWDSLGTVFVLSTAGKVHVGDTATIRLPDGFKFGKSGSNAVMSQDDWNTIVPRSNGTVVGAVYDASVGHLDPAANFDQGCYFFFPTKYQDNKSGLYDWSMLDAATPPAPYQAAIVALEVKALDDNEIKVEVVRNPLYTGSMTDVDPTKETYMYVYLNNVYIDEGFEGDIYAEIEAPSNSGIASGKIPVGKVAGGNVDVKVTNVPNFADNTNEDGNIKIRIQEPVADTLKDKNESLKFKLPRGFEWDATNEDVSLLWGNDADITDANANGTNKDEIETYLENRFNIDEDVLTLDLPSGFASEDALYFELTIDITVEDETEAELGDVTAKIYGETGCNQSEVIVAKYGQYDIICTAGEPTTIYAGLLEQAIAPITIEESIAGSLTNGRTILLTLPANAKWGKLDSDGDLDETVDLDFVGFPGKDGRTAKWVVTGTSTSAEEFKLDDLEVVVEPGFTGELVVEVSGTAGIDAELTVANVELPVTITASETPELVIGASAQKAGDLTITEAAAGALNQNQDLKIVLPDGIEWTSTPTVTVTEGDLDIDIENVETNDNELIIPIDKESDEASTITITDCEYTVYRTVPEGDVVVKVKGDAAIEVNDPDETHDYFTRSVVSGINTNYVEINGEQAFELEDDWNDGMVFENSTTAAKTVSAVIGTPAPSDKNVTAEFVLGSTTYKQNGVEQQMDVAPYAKDGRTYLPVRYVAYALGVADDNIMYDSASQTVTMIKGDKVVQLTIGSTTMVVNGAEIAMDVAPEAVDGRTMLPFRWIAWAFGAQVNWDGATQTVTMIL